MWWWRTKLWLFELIKHLVPSAQDDVGLQAELKKQNMSSKSVGIVRQDLVRTGVADYQDIPHDHNLERRWFNYDNLDQSEWYELLEGYLKCWLGENTERVENSWSGRILISEISMWGHSHISWWWWYWWKTIIIIIINKIIFSSLSLPQKMTLSFDCQSGVPNNLVGTGCMWCWRWWRWRWQINPKPWKRGRRGRRRARWKALWAKV